MAPPLAARAETTPSLIPSSQLMVGLGSVAPILLLIFLLLLCFPFKRKKRQFSTTTPKQDLNASELIRMTKLEDRPRLAETSLPGGKLHKGGLLPNCQAEKQTNDVGAGDFQLGSSDSGKDTVGPSHPSPEKFTMPSSDPLGSLAPQAACPSTTTPSLLQLRKLPMTPKEAHLTAAEPLSVSGDSQVYESIQAVDRVLCAKSWPEGPDPPARAAGHFTGPVDSGEKATGTLEQPQLAVALQPNEPPQPLLGLPSAKESSTPPASDKEKRLSLIYARVCKKAKAAQPLQPADPHRPAHQEEEEPPPIPEKQFENLYESLCINTEMQGGSVPSATTPNQQQTPNQTADPQIC